MCWWINYCITILLFLCKTRGREQLVAEPGVGRNHGEDTVGPRFGQDPPPSFCFHLPTVEARPWVVAGDLIFAGVVVDDASIQDDGLDLIVGELDRCWEVTQNQDK